MASVSPRTTPEDKPPNIEVFTEGSEELAALIRRVRAKGADAFLPHVTTAYRAGRIWTHRQRFWHRMGTLAHIAFIALFAYVSTHFFTLGVDNEDMVAGTICGLLAVGGALFLWARIASRDYLLVASDTLGHCRGWRWQKNLRLYHRADLRCFEIVRIERTRSRGRERGSYTYQAAWGLRAIMADETGWLLTPVAIGIPLKDELAAYTWLGHLLAEWAGVPLMSELGDTAADYAPAAPDEAPVKTDIAASVPPRMRLLPPGTQEGASFAESFRPQNVAASMWPPAGAFGISVSPPTRGCLGWLGWAALGCVAPIIMLVALGVADTDTDNPFGLLTVAGFFSLFFLWWWLTSLADPFLRVDMLLTPEALHIRTGWIWRHVRAIPRASIKEVKLEKTGSVDTEGDIQSVSWRLSLADGSPSGVIILKYERDHKTATWLTDLLTRWVSA